MRISAGHLLVGKTSANNTDVGTTIYSTLGFSSTRSGGVVGILNRTANDGDIMQFRRGGTSVGSWASRAGVVSTIILDPRSGGGGLSGGGAALYPTNNVGALSNGALTLGDASYKFNDGHFSGTVNTGSLTVTGTINGGDLRGEVWTIGRDSNDYFSVGTTSHKWYLDGAEDMRLENDGDLHVEGNIVAYSTTVSDERLKTDIVKIDGALDKVAQLNGYTFTYTADGKKSAGVIAQEVQKVLPSAIVESKLPLKMGDDDETEYMTVQYDQLMGLMIEAIKELKAEVAELKGK
jgi:hypothetical protein